MITRIRKNGKAIIPVIAAVNMAAVTLAISVAYRLGGKECIYADFENTGIMISKGTAADEALASKPVPHWT